MSDGPEYPKVVIGPGGVSRTVNNAAEEDAWVNAPLPPGYVETDADRQRKADAVKPAGKKPAGKGASDA